MKLLDLSQKLKVSFWHILISSSECRCGMLISLAKKVENPSEARLVSKKCTLLSIVISLSSSGSINGVMLFLIFSTISLVLLAYF